MKPVGLGPLVRLVLVRSALKITRLFVTEDQAIFFFLPRAAQPTSDFWTAFFSYGEAPFWGRSGAHGSYPRKDPYVVKKSVMDHAHECQQAGGTYDLFFYYPTIYTGRLCTRSELDGVDVDEEDLGGGSVSGSWSDKRYVSRSLNVSWKINVSCSRISS